MALGPGLAATEIFILLVLNRASAETTQAADDEVDLSTRASMMFLMVGCQQRGRNKHAVDYTPQTFNFKPFMIRCLLSHNKGGLSGTVVKL